MFDLTESSRDLTYTFERALVQEAAYPSLLHSKNRYNALSLASGCNETTRIHHALRRCNGGMAGAARHRHLA